MHLDDVDVIQLFVDHDLTRDLFDEQRNTRDTWTTYSFENFKIFTKVRQKSCAFLIPNKYFIFNDYSNWFWSFFIE